MTLQPVRAILKGGHGKGLPSLPIFHGFADSVKWKGRYLFTTAAYHFSSRPSTDLGRQHKHQASHLCLEKPVILSCCRGNFLPCRSVRTVAPKDFAPSSKSIENVLLTNNCEYRHGHTSFVSKCFSCHGVGKNGEDGKLTLFVNEVTGSYVCKSCGIHGSWSELTNNLSQRKIATLDQFGEVREMPVIAVDLEQESGFQLKTGSRMLTDLSNGEISKLKAKFGLEKISKETLQKYFVTTGSHTFSGDTGDFKDGQSLIFPIFDISRKLLIGAKFHSSDKNYHSELKPSGSCPGLFGWHTIKADAKKLILTANEFDALAIYEATSLPSMAIPSGTMTLPPEVLPQLEQFDEIVLWFGEDIKSRNAVNHFAKKIGMDRCHFVRNKNDGTALTNGAFEAFQQGVDIKSLLEQAFPVSHPEILTFDQLRHDLYMELCNAEQAAGVKWRRFPLLNSILKGHRRGELTIFTGSTGAGKTTLLSELSLDLSTQGVSTLWGSFEVRNVRLLRTMINQLSGLDMEENLDQYDRWGSKLESLPLYFMDFYGSQSLQTVINTMSHAAYVYDIEHVIIDNLQFMTDGQGSKFDDTFFRMNNALSVFRKFATYRNVHVTLVIHPRKENDNVELQTASVFGTAKATQEADNVLILQSSKEGNKFLEVTKNRFDGTLGRIPLTFHQSSLSLSGFHRDHRTLESAYASRSALLQQKRS